METKEPITEEEASKLTAQQVADALNDKDKIIDELEKERNDYKLLYEWHSKRNDELKEKLNKVSTLIGVAKDIIN